MNYSLKDSDMFGDYFNKMIHVASSTLILSIFKSVFPFFIFYYGAKQVAF